MINITPSTTLTELGSFLKSSGLSLRICQMGSGFICFVRGFNRDGMGYSPELTDAIKMAIQQHTEQSPTLHQESRA